MMEKKIKTKEEEEEAAWILKLKLKEEEEEERKKKHYKELEDESHHKMAKFGFQENQIERVLDLKKAQDLPTGYAPGQLGQHSTSTQLTEDIRNTPTYTKISKNHIEIETLNYYNLPYKIDTDPNYVIILQEITQAETDILFEHTCKLRRGSSKFLIEDRRRDRQGEPQIAFVRRRRPGATPSRLRKDKSPIRTVLNLFGEESGHQDAPASPAEPAAQEPADTLEAGPGFEAIQDSIAAQQKTAVNTSTDEKKEPDGSKMTSEVAVSRDTD